MMVVVVLSCKMLKYCGDDIVSSAELLLLLSLFHLLLLLLLLLLLWATNERMANKWARERERARVNETVWMKREGGKGPGLASPGPWPGPGLALSACFNGQIPTSWWRRPEKDWWHENPQRILPRWLCPSDGGLRWGWFKVRIGWGLRWDRLVGWVGRVGW